MNSVYIYIFSQNNLKIKQNIKYFICNKKPDFLKEIIYKQMRRLLQFKVINKKQNIIIIVKYY